MNPDNIIFLIALCGGITIGTVAGFLAAGMFTAAKLKARERETWRRAERFWQTIIQENRQ